MHMIKQAEIRDIFTQSHQGTKQRKGINGGTNLLTASIQMHTHLSTGGKLGAVKAKEVQMRRAGEPTKHGIVVRAEINSSRLTSTVHEPSFRLRLTESQQGGFACLCSIRGQGENPSPVVEGQDCRANRHRQQGQQGQGGCS